MFDKKIRVIVRFNGDGQGDKFWYQVDTRLELSLIGHLAYRYIGRKYRDISIYK